MVHEVCSNSSKIHKLIHFGNNDKLFKLATICRCLILTVVINGLYNRKTDYSNSF